MPDNPPMPEVEFPQELGTFTVLGELGRGVYGTVLQVVDKAAPNELRAIKIMDNEPAIGRSGERDGHLVEAEVSSIRELAILRLLKHPNIVEVITTHFTRDQSFIVMESMEKSLYDEIRAGAKKMHAHSADTPASKVCLPADVQKHYLRQMLSGLDYCHSNMVVHRDIKPQNILVSSHPQPADRLVKLCDFGMAREIEHPPRRTTRDVVTLFYRAPELMLDMKGVAHTSIDLWSTGAIMAEMATGELLFPGTQFQGPKARTSEVCVLVDIFRKLGTPRDVHYYNALPLFPPSAWPSFPTPDPQSLVPSLDPQASLLLAELLHYSPLERISAEEALEHPWLSD